MSIPYFPLYPSDFTAGAAHLTLAEDGAYNRLLRLCWMTPGCSIPADRSWIYRRMIARSNDDEKVIDAIISEFFKTKNQRVFNTRLMGEYKKTQTKIKTARENGLKGGRPCKPLKTNEIKKANGYENKTQKKAIQNQNQSKKDTTNVVSKETVKRRSQIPKDWQPTKAGIEFARKKEMDDGTIRNEIEKFTNHARSNGRAMLDWSAAWRTWVNNWVSYGCNQAGKRNGASIQRGRASFLDVVRDEWESSDNAGTDSEFQCDGQIIEGNLIEGNY